MKSSNSLLLLTNILLDTLFYFLSLMILAYIIGFSIAVIDVVAHPGATLTVNNFWIGILFVALWIPLRVWRGKRSNRLRQS